jgi:hypothetical protein
LKRKAIYVVRLVEIIGDIREESLRRRNRMNAEEFQNWKRMGRRHV